MLDSTFIDELSSAIQASIPARYQSSIIDGPVIGEVMPNAFKLYKEPRDHSHDLTDIPSPVSLEIKVKGGHPSVSPFLAPTSIKRRYGRHHLKELAGLGDSAEFEVALSHRPTDLGSRDYDVIKKYYLTLPAPQEGLAMLSAWRACPGPSPISACVG